ncbi:hypothetical protein ASE66_23690 [Bosea sp. Root483D1]|nr:hypothetical protein ASE66_23690 [Bosea sp. Root483D1]
MRLRECRGISRGPRLSVPAKLNDCTLCEIILVERQWNQRSNDIGDVVSLQLARARRKRRLELRPGLFKSGLCTR